MDTFHDGQNDGARVREYPPQENVHRRKAQGENPKRGHHRKK